MIDPEDRLVRITTTPPQDGRARKRYLFITPATGLQEVIALGQTIAWVKTHWDPMAQTIRPHFEGRCELCNHTKAVTLGFLAAYQHKIRLVGLLPIPWEAWVNSPSLQRFNGNLRGRAIDSSRKRPTKNGPVRMFVREGQFDGKLPDAFDVVDAVCRHLDIAPANIFDREVHDVRVNLAAEETNPSHMRTQ